MEKELTLKKRIRQVIVARNTVEAMAKGKGYRSPFGKKYINEMAGEVINLAERTHPLLPYYLITRTI